MVARKKRPAKVAGKDAPFVVVLEDLRSRFSVFGEALQGFRQEVAQQFEQVANQFEQVANQFDQVANQFDQVDRRSGRLELAVLENGRGIQELRGELGDVRATVTRIETALAAKVDRNEVESIVERALARR